MQIIREWLTDDGHTIALVQNGRREQRDYGEQPFAVLWLQNLDGDLGSITLLADFATAAAACAFVQTGRVARPAR